MESVRKGRGPAGWGGGGDEGRRRTRLVHRLLQEDQVPVPQGPRGGLCHDGLPHRLVQGPPPPGLLRRLLLHPGQGFDATFMCQGMDVCKAKMREIESKEKPSPVEEDILVTLEVVYEFYLRGFTFEHMDLYRSHAVNFLPDNEKGSLLPPFTLCAWSGRDGGLVYHGAAGGKAVYIHRGVFRSLSQGLQDPHRAAQGRWCSGRHAGYESDYPVRRTVLTGMPSAACSVRAFCRRQNLEAGRIDFVPPDGGKRDPRDGAAAPGPCRIRVRLPCSTDCFNRYPVLCCLRPLLGRRGISEWNLQL